MNHDSQELPTVEASGCKKRSITNAGTVAFPARAGLLRTCPNCLRWFALRHIASVDDQSVGKILRYRCKRCGKEVDYLRHRPDGRLFY
jgi:hypothetical protein